MRFVPLKTVESQDIQAIHRMRSRLVKERTALVNQIRGLLAKLAPPLAHRLRGHEDTTFPQYVFHNPAAQAEAKV